MAAGRDKNLLRRIVRTTRRMNPSDGQGPYRTPPFLSFDPAIEAERRAAIRGLRDTGQDTRIAARRAKRDLQTELKDLRVTRKRGFQDLKRDKSRSLRDIGFEKADVRLGRERGMEDFSMRLNALTRQFTQLGRSQTQAANAQGVLGGGTAAASAAAREQNLAFARQPLDIGAARLDEDARIALERLGIQAEDVRQDTTRGRKRLKQDVRHDSRLARRDYGRTLTDLYNQLERAIREQRIGDVDLIKEEIFNARQNNPGAFSKYGKKGGE
jgi:serine phosphatase RsbU (regulator of sigma subunit)